MIKALGTAQMAPTLALLGAQDGKCAELSAQGCTAQGEEGSAGNLDGRGPDLGAQGLRPLCANVPSQVPEGSRLLGEGSGSPAGLLRFPGRILGTHTDDEPH